MTAALLFIIKIIWFIAPAGYANMMPVFIRSIFNFLAYPVDFNKKIGGEPIFGKNKTWRGVIFAPITGVAIFWLQRQLMAIPELAEISIINYETAPLWWGALLGLGAIVGDLVKSFFKRRLKIPPGVSWFPFDQTDYVIGALLFLAPWFFPGWGFTLGLLAVGIVLHILTNVLGHLVKLRKDWI